MAHNKWHTVTSREELNRIIHLSDGQPQLIFKHSSRCGISSLVKNRIEKELVESSGIEDIHLVDVISSRPISNQIAVDFGVHHESPQMLIISSGQCIYHTSHFDISLKNIPSIKED